MKQAGPIESRIAATVRDPSTGQRIGSRLNAFEGEAKLLSYAPARLVAGGTGEADPPHFEGLECVTHHGIGRLRRNPLPPSALANTVAGIAYARLPVDVVKAAPDDRLTGGSLDSGADSIEPRAIVKLGGLSQAPDRRLIA